MEVKVLNATKNPLDLISEAAGLCYGKTEYSYNRVKRCFKSGHHSVLEHASVTFLVSDVSRTCTHQLVRHRLASYSQKSQRYVVVNDAADWFVIPPSIQENPEAYQVYVDGMKRDMLEYQTMLTMGIKPEDARFKLPEGTKTEIAVTMNLRELYHFFDVRYAADAQWEIRELACKMIDSLKCEGEQWTSLISLWEDRE